MRCKTHQTSDNLYGSRRQLSLEGIDEAFHGFRNDVHVRFIGEDKENWGYQRVSASRD